MLTAGDKSIDEFGGELHRSLNGYRYACLPLRALVNGMKHSVDGDMEIYLPVCMLDVV